MSYSTDKGPGKYQIKLEKSSAERGWHSLEEEFPEAMAKCRHFLEEMPTNFLMSHGKAKRLKGKLKWLSQYDVTDSARVRYWVDKNDRIVYVEYAGPHP